MAFEPLYDVIQADYKKKIGASQVVVECRLTPDASVQIRKVLSIACSESVQSCELLAGEARVTGRVNFKVLFSDADENLHCMDYNADFSEKIMDEGILPGMKAEPVCGILDTDTVSVSTGEIKLACVVEINLFSVLSESVSCLQGAGEDLFTQKEKLEYRTATATCDLSFLVAENTPLKETAERVLMCDGSVILKSADAGIDVIHVKGTAALNVLIEGEDKKLFHCPVVFDFEEELAASGAMPENAVHADLAVKSMTARLEKDIESSNAALGAEVQIGLSAVCYTASEGETVTDAFSVTNEIMITGESFSLKNFQFCRCFDEKIEGSASLDADMPYMDNILAVCATRINIANAFAEAGAVRLEGLINTGIIYWNAESESKASVQVELPYSLTIPCDGMEEGCEVSAKGIVTDISARPKKGTEIDITARACFYINVYKSVLGYCVKEVELGAQRNTSMSAIAVYITKEGETLWDVAKALCTTPELIMQYNPALEVPITGGERILVYRQL